MTTVRPRVGLLTYGVDRQLSGVQRVALELGRALQHGRECEIFYLTPYREGPFRHEHGYRSWYLPGCSRLPVLMALGGPLLELAARRLGLDIVHDPTGTSPFLLGRWGQSAKRIVMIHDAIAFRYPEGYPWLNNLLHRRYVPATLGNVDGIITPSHHAGEDVQRFLHVPAYRLHVVQSGVSDRFRPVETEVARRVADRHGLTGPYILSVGAQQARKNVGRLVDAFARLHVEHPEHRLAIAGPTLWRHAGLREQVKRLGISDAVKILGYVPEDDLPALYSGASCFVFPSLYEGFGLPVLEAMACGTPVICSDSTSLPEVAGEAALLVDPYDVEGLADAMQRVVSEASVTAALRRRGLERAGQFTWDRTARETVDVYRRLAYASAGHAAAPREGAPIR